MNRNIEKIKAFLYALKSNQYDGGKEFESIIEFIELVLKANSIDNIKNKDNETMRALKASVFGIFFDNYGKIADTAINFCPELNEGEELSTCSTASTAILTRYAFNDVPIGCWGSYLLKILSIDEHFKKLINTAIYLSTEDILIKEIMDQKLFGDATKIHAAISISLYCCLISQNKYNNAIIFARKTEIPIVPIITGMLMATKTSLKIETEAWDDKIEKLAAEISEKEFENIEDNNYNLFSNILPAVPKALGLSSQLPS